jgi:hypothetical protein
MPQKRYSNSESEKVDGYNSMVTVDLCSGLLIVLEKSATQPPGRTQSGSLCERSGFGYHPSLESRQLCARKLQAISSTNHEYDGMEAFAYQ